MVKHMAKNDAHAAEKKRLKAEKDKLKREESRQKKDIKKRAKEIAKQSRELIKRFEVFYGHFDKIDSAISNARTAFDKAVSSYNSRLLPSFNRFKTLSGGTEKEQEMLEENYSE